MTILLLALPLAQVKRILDKMKKKQTPKYSQNTRYIILDKNQFEKDLLWTTKNKQKIKISTLFINKIMVSYYEEEYFSDTKP